MPMELMRYRLKQLREQKGYKQEDVAVILGISRSAYTLFETGERKPKIEYLEKIADTYDITLDYLFGREKPTKFSNLSQ